MEKQVIARSSRILLRRTGEADLDFVLWAENHEDNTPFVGQWTGNEHRRAFMDDNMEHLIIETFPAGQRIGYVIMRGLGENHRSIELKRIVITEKNQGYGRETLRMVKKLCFEEWRAHRLWLDVKEHNMRACHLYESEGFVREGVLRECIWNGETYESLIVMSMLEQEYFSQSGDGI